MVFHIGDNTNMRIFFREVKTNQLRVLSMSEEFSYMLNDQEQMIKMILEDMQIHASKPVLGLYENTQLSKVIA